MLTPRIARAATVTQRRQCFRNAPQHEVKDVGQAKAIEVDPRVAFSVSTSRGQGQGGQNLFTGQPVTNWKKTAIAASTPPRSSAAIIIVSINNKLTVTLQKHFHANRYRLQTNSTCCRQGQQRRMLTQMTRMLQKRNPRWNIFSVWQRTAPREMS